MGETGTGKEVVARALHRHGPRASHPFVAVPCGAIPRELAESELFGHEKGSFTGAAKRRTGLFEQADGGTLLLDDVDDLPLDLQVKLLRVLQEGRFTRVGGTSEVVVDVRVVATTKVTLREAVAAGKFREDVYYRLRGLELRMPPLRERGDDALLLARFFLDQLAQRHGTEAMTLSAAAVSRLRRYCWPGNVRELRRTIEAAVVVCAGGEILPEHLPEDVQDVQVVDGEGLFSLHLGACHDVPFQDVVHHFEDALIDWAMDQAAGQQGKAADLLGLPRTTLQSKLARRTPA
jgi:DNA-binding NtrC family response regulator